MPKPLIIGAHAVIFSRDADRDRAFLRDVLQLASVDAGGGWLIFGLPPSELAVHPAEQNDRHELYLLTKDVAALVAALAARHVECSPPQTLSWGVLTRMTLPGGGTLGIYEPRHAQPKRATPPRPRSTRRSSTTRRSRPARKTQRKPRSRSRR